MKTYWQSLAGACFVFSLLAQPSFSDDVFGASDAVSPGLHALIAQAIGGPSNPASVAELENELQPLIEDWAVSQQKYVPTDPSKEVDPVSQLTKERQLDIQKYVVARQNPRIRQLFKKATPLIVREVEKLYGEPDAGKRDDSAMNKISLSQHGKKLLVAQAQWNLSMLTWSMSTKKSEQSLNSLMKTVERGQLPPGIVPKPDEQDRSAIVTTTGTDGHMMGFGS